MAIALGDIVVMVCTPSVVVADEDIVDLQAVVAYVVVLELIYKGVQALHKMTHGVRVERLAEGRALGLWLDDKAAKVRLCTHAVKLLGENIEAAELAMAAAKQRRGLLS